MLACMVKRKADLENSHALAQLVDLLLTLTRVKRLVVHEYTDPNHYRPILLKGRKGASSESNMRTCKELIH